MSNKFNIDITARDKASQVFAKMQSRVQVFNGDLSKMNRVAQRGAEVFRSMVPNIAAISSIGSMAGLGAMTKQFGDSSMSLSNMADNLGLSTTKLQELHGAAKLAGLSVGSIDSGMKSLGTTMENAMFGRANGNETKRNLAALGIEIHKTAKGGPDTHRALLDISNAIRKLHNPQAQEALASRFGLDGLLPLLRKGSDGIKELEGRSEKLGMVQSEASIRGGKSLYESLTKLDGAATGLGNAIASGLSPSVSSIANDTAKWVEQNKGLIAQDVAGWANKIGSAFAYAQKEMVLLMEFGDKLGGWVYDHTHKAYDPNLQPNGMTLDKTGHQMYPGDHMPVGIRQNNPGNIRHWNGAMTAKNGFAVFPTPKAGIEAMTANLSSYNKKYHIDTIDGIINRWAPSSDGNNTRAYIADVSKQTGYAPGDHLDMNSQATMDKLVNAIIQHENGKNPYAPAMVKGAVAGAMGQRVATDSPAPQKVAVEVTLHNAPVGTQARVTSDHGATVRINHAMPGANTP